MQTKVLYKIYTEDKNLPGIENAVSFYFPGGATIYTGRGFYEGNIENCVIIEIVLDKKLGQNLKNGHFEWENDKKVVRFADAIKKINNQNSILITKQEIEAEFR